MDNETESQELNRAYREYSEVQQKLEQAAQEEIMRAVAQAERTLVAFNHFLSKVL